MISLSKINFRKYLLIAGIALIIIGFILAPYDQFVTDITPQKVHFTSKNDGIPITGNLYLPENFNSSQAYPAVVLVHGINDFAERHHHAAVEFVRRDFIALAIYLRGHTNSGGLCTLSAKEPWDIMGAADYLLSNYNLSNLAVVGHSLGGMSAIRAAANDTRFNATVVMGPPISLEIAFKRYVPDLDLILPYEYLLSFHFNFSDPYEQYIRSPVFWINQTSPNNLFYILGGKDTAATPEEALLCIANVTGNSSVEVNVEYGEFTAGNRTKLQIYPGIDHGSEPVTPEIIRDTVIWIERAFGLSNGNFTLDDMIQWNLGSSGGNFVLYGYLILIFPVISYISTLLYNPNTLERPKNAPSLDRKKKFLSVGIYSGIFIGASTLTFPIIVAMNYVNWSPYNIAGGLVNVLTVQGLLIGLALIPTIIFEKRKYNLTWIDFGLKKSNILSAALIGVLISIFLIFGYFFLPLLSMPWYLKFPPDWIGYILIFLNYLLVSIIGEIYLRGLIQTKLFKPQTRLRNWLSILIIALIGGLIQGTALLFMILWIPNLSLSLGDLTLNLYLIGFIGGVTIFTALGVLNGWIFLKTQHILPAAIVQATLLSWLLCTFMVPL